MHGWRLHRIAPTYATHGHDSYAMSGGEASAAAAADATAGGTRGLQANTSAGRSSAGRAVLLVDVEDEHEDGTKAAPDTKVIAGINK